MKTLRGSIVGDLRQVDMGLVCSYVTMGNEKLIWCPVGSRVDGGGMELLSGC